MVVQGGEVGAGQAQSAMNLTVPVDALDERCSNDRALAPDRRPLSPTSRGRKWCSRSTGVVQSVRRSIHGHPQPPLASRSRSSRTRATTKIPPTINRDQPIQAGLVSREGCRCRSSRLARSRPALPGRRLHQPLERTRDHPDAARQRRKQCRLVRLGAGACWPLSPGPPGHARFRRLHPDAARFPLDTRYHH